MDCCRDGGHLREEPFDLQIRTLHFRGHEAIQLATAFHLQPCDWVSPYYRDESLLLGLGFEPYELMLQLLAKGDDIFTGGREYYSHPNYRGPDRPNILHQSSATGMQAIPTTGIAQGLAFLERIRSSLLVRSDRGEAPVVVCSLGDASVTEGEVSEAFQFAVLKKLPIIYLVQDNDWGISVRAEESRAMDAYDYAAGFSGMGRLRIDGSDFPGCYETMARVIAEVRAGKATVPGPGASAAAWASHERGAKRILSRSGRSCVACGEGSYYAATGAVALSGGDGGAVGGDRAGGAGPCGRAIFARRWRRRSRSRPVWGRMFLVRRVLWRRWGSGRRRVGKKL